MIENELRQLISKAKACLTDLCPYTTHVAQLALEDMIQPVSYTHLTLPTNGDV